MKDQEKQDIVAKEVDGNAIDALSAELADSIAAQSEQPQELQNAFDEKEKELEDEGLVSKGEDAAVVAAADGDLAAMIAADTNAQGGDAAASGGSESGVSAGMMVAAGAVAVGGIVAASGGDGGSGGGKNNQEFTVSIDSPSATEGDSGTKVLNFTVTLDEAPKKESTFNYSVTGGTATGDVDFDRDSGTVTFAPGQTEATISVVVRGDTTFEADETVLLTVSGAKVEGQNNSVTATGTIVNDDPDPATLQYDLSVNSPTVVEGDDGTVVLRYELTLDRVPTEAVQVGFETLTSGTATADVDFVAAAGSVTFTAGQDSAIVDIVVNGDEVLEANETVDVRFTGPQLSAPVTGTGTIIENDLDPTVDAKSATTSPDDLTANIINANPEFTPGGNTLINTFQDEDSYTGVGVDPTLNVVLGNPNDLQEVIVTPKVDGFKIANFEFTAGTPAFGTNVTGGVDFQDFTGLEELNVNRVLTTNGAIVLQNIARETDDVSVMDATRGGVLNFNYQEEVLTGTNEVLDFAVEDTRLAALNLVEGTDGGSDAGFFFEEINMSSNNITDIDLFVIQANGREDLVAGNAPDTTKQVFNLTAGDGPGASGFTEFNRLLITGVDTWNLEANHVVDVAIDPEVPLTSGLFVAAAPPAPAVLGNDGVNSTDLEALNISGAGDVLIDGLEGNVGVFADTAGLTVDGSAMTGDLTIGISGGTGDEAGAGGGAPALANTALDDLFSLTSGSGDDTVATYGILGGDIATGAGADNVLVTVGTIAAPANTDGLANMLGTASIETGAGADVVSAANLGVLFFAGGLAGGTTDQNAVNNSGFDDILDAYISTGADDDTVTVGTLMSGQDWDNFQLNDANIDDLFFVSGSWVDLGSGNNTVTLASMMEGTKVMAEDGNDTLNVELGAIGTILAADTNADLQTLGNSANTQPGVGGTKEVDLNGNVDRFGAIVELGGGDDVANFIDSTSLATENQIIVGRDAELRAGGGADAMNVTALDSTLVNTTTSAADQDALTTGVQTDANANILGVETLNATIENQIDGTTAAATGLTQNDNVETDGMVQVDVMRFDSALTDINLVSNEQRLLQNPTTEVYEQGEQTTFNVFNLRQPSVSLSLMAHEASGISGANGPSNGAAPATGNLQDDRIIDVTLNADLDDARADDDTFELDILAGSESFDLSLNLGMTTTDLVGDAASATDDDDLLAEHAVINLQDDQSHRLLFNGFGDAGQTNEYVEGSLNVETSVTINDSKAGTEIVIDQVSADTVTSLGAADTEVYVSGANNYEITTGAGDDLFDMFYDVVRADDIVDDAADADAVDNTNEADILQGGGGVNRLRVSGDNNLGSSNAVINGNTDDDVFENIFNFDDLEIGTEIVTGAGRTGNEFFAGGTANNVVLDEAAQDQTNLKNFIFTGGDWTTDANGNVIAGNGAQTTDVTVGENFENDLTFTSVEEGNEKQARLNLVVENQDSDTDVDLVNMDFFLSTQFGTSLVFENTGDPDADVNITVNVSDIAGDTTRIEDTTVTGNPFGNGFLDLQVQMGDLDSLTLLDNKSDADSDNDDNDQIVVTVADTWSMTQPGAAQNDTFTVDASAVEDDDAIVGGVANPNSTQTGGMIFDGSAETDSDLLVKGTQNDDFFAGGQQDDTFEGNGGDDEAFSGQGDDTLLGGAGNDELHGQVGDDTIDGGEGDDRLWGNDESDTLTGGAGADAFIYNATSDSDGSQNSTDTITDFEEGIDSIEYTIDRAGSLTDDVFNLGRFAQVNDLGAGDNSLDGTTVDRVFGDSFWAGTGQFVIDVDGNGDVTEGDDLQIDSSGSIGAGDLDIDINAGSGNDLIRGGQGVNDIFGNGGDDRFVFVGSINTTQANIYQGTAAGIIAANPGFDAILSTPELTNVRSVSDVVMGDTLDGGAGNDTAHFFGVVNAALINNGGPLGVENVVIHSDVTMTVEQLLALDTLTFDGNTAHTLTIIDVDANGNVKTLNAAEIQDALSGNYANDADDVNAAGQTNGQTVTLQDAGGNPVVINGVTITVAQSEALAMGEDDAPLAGNVLTNELDASLVSVKSVDNVDGNVGLNVQGEYGNIVINSNGTYNYTLGAGATVANINTLDAGEVVTDQFAYTLQTAGGDESTTAFVNVTITGVNDAAVITNSATAAVGAVTEDAVTLSTSGDLNHTDIDGDDVDDAWFIDGGNLAFGSFTSNASGAWTYNANNASLQSLDAGATTTDSFTLTTTDGTTQVVTVTLTGVEDQSTVTAGSTITGAVTEDGALTATGDVNSNDVDAGDLDDAWSVAAAAATNGGLGTYSVTAAGAWTYNANNAALQFLDAGQTTTDSFTLTTTDMTTQVVTVTVTGIEDQSTVTAGSTTTGAVTEDGALTASGDLNSADADANDADDAWEETLPGGVTNAGFGTYSNTATGNWIYSVSNAAIQSLDAGITTTDSFTMTTTDGTTQVVTVTVTGAEDLSTVTAGSTITGAVVEDAVAVALGDVNSEDVDTGDTDDAWAASAGAGANGLGTYTSNAAGIWSYNLTNGAPAVQALDAGVTATDTFTLATTDGTVATVTITVTGAEDQSSITSTAAQAAGAITEDAVSVAGDLDSNDVDTGDADDAWEVAAGAATNAGFGTYSSTVNGVWTYNINNAVVQFLDAGVTTTDSFTMSTTDGTMQLVTVTITGAEDAPTIDVAPVFNVGGFSFTASDVDGDALTLVTPVADGSNAVNNGAPSAFTASVGAAAVNDLQVTDGASNVDLGVSLVEGTAGADNIDQSAAGEAVAIYGFGGDDNALIGGASDDYIAGGTGLDTMTGNGGSDTFGFAHGDSTDAALDLITDWSAADQIDLSILGTVAGYQESGSDANLAAAQASANAVFGGDTSDIYASAFGGNTIVFVDSDNDDVYTAGTDLAFQLTGVSEAALDVSNFVV